MNGITNKQTKNVRWMSVVIITTVDLMSKHCFVSGFLSTGDSHAPGNYGLLDQVAALHWISDNIQVFGGDPRQVTLLGHGYGAAMVNLLLLSPATRGQQFLISASSAIVWAIQSFCSLLFRQICKILPIAMGLCVSLCVCMSVCLFLSFVQIVP